MGLDVEKYEDLYIKLLVHSEKTDKQLEHVTKQSDRQQVKIIKLNEELESNHSSDLNKLEKSDKQLKHIMKQSDRQQIKMIKLKEQIEESHAYDVAQQELASTKVEANIVNELDSDEEIESYTIFTPSDILSGDFYSLFKRDDGSRFFYLIDGQGHGISPSLTVFAVSTIISKAIRQNLKFQELLDYILPNITQYLADEEQLSFTLVEIDAEYKKLQYVNGGMYPMLLKDGENVLRLKANSLPIMDFSFELKAKTVNIEDFKSVMIYSDGITEADDDRLLKYAPEILIEQPELIAKAIEEIPDFTRDDDITMVALFKK